jgi:hypothetical protein
MDSVWLAAAASSRPCSDCTQPRLFRLAATSGWSGPCRASSIASARVWLAAGHAHAALLPAKNTTCREDYERLVVVGGGINSIWLSLCSRWVL